MKKIRQSFLRLLTMHVLSITSVSLASEVEIDQPSDQFNKPEEGYTADDSGLSDAEYDRESLDSGTHSPAPEQEIEEPSTRTTVVTLQELQQSFNKVGKQTNNQTTTQLVSGLQSGNQELVEEGVGNVNKQIRVLKLMFQSGDTNVSAQKLDQELRLLNDKVSSLAGLRDMLQASGDESAVVQLNDIIKNANALKKQVEEFGTPFGSVKVIEVQHTNDRIQIDDQLNKLQNFENSTISTKGDQTNLIVTMQGLEAGLQKALTRWPDAELQEYFESSGAEILERYNNALDTMINRFSFDVFRTHQQDIDAIVQQIPQLIQKMQSVAPEFAQKYADQIQTITSQVEELVLQKNVAMLESQLDAAQNKLYAVPDAWYSRLWNNLNAFFPRRAGKDSTKQVVVDTVNLFKNATSQCQQGIESIIARNAGKPLSDADQQKINNYLNTLFVQKKALNDFAATADQLGGQFSTRHDLETVVRQVGPLVDQAIVDLIQAHPETIINAAPEVIADMLEADVNAQRESSLVTLFKEDRDMNDQLNRAIRNKYESYGVYSWLAGVKHNGVDVDLTSVSSLNNLLEAVSNLTEEQKSNMSQKEQLAFIKEQVLNMTQEQFIEQLESKEGNSKSGEARDWIKMAGMPRGFTILKELLINNGATDALRKEITEGQKVYDKLLNQQVFVGMQLQ